MLLRRLFTVVFLFALALPVAAQTAKKPLDHSVYDSWRSVSGESISADGKWLMYTLEPQEGDAVLELRSVAGPRFFRIDRGESGQFTRDNSHAVYLIKPPFEAARQARRDKKKADEQPKQALGITHLASGDQVILERIKSFKMPEEAGGWLAYLKEKPAPDTTKSDSTKTVEEKPEEPKEPEEESAESEDKQKEVKKREDPGFELVLRHLTTGTETSFADVTDYSFSEDGMRLVFVRSSKDGTTDGIYSVHPESGTVTTLMEGMAHYASMAISKNGQYIAFSSNRETYAAEPTPYSLFLFSGGEVTAVVDSNSTFLPAGWHASPDASLSFSEESKRLQFGLAPVPPKEAEKIPDDEKVDVDIWSWTDPHLQPMQLLNASSEKKRSYLTVLDLDSGTITQIEDETMPSASIGSRGDGRFALANNNTNYRQEISWESPGINDVILIDVETGSKTTLLEGFLGSASLSPGSSYVYWWDGTQTAWFVQPTTGGAAVNVSAAIPQRTDNELHDWPYITGSYGTAGWTSSDEKLLIHDMYDIWEVDPTGTTAPRSITEGIGREMGIRFRNVRLDSDDPYIDPTAPLLLNAFHLETKDEGFYSDSVTGTAVPSRILFTAHAYSNPRKAKDADVLMYARSTFTEFPDLWTSNMTFGNTRKHSNANPQQSEYLWGTSELVSWHSVEGTPLQGILIKPENFDPSKKYPMLAYFYERSSDGLHQHRAPEPYRSIINPTWYASNGYLVFIPDIPYQIGYPGESAMDAVMPGILSLIEKGFVDKERIGVEGHSWGGYQIAYMVTKTNLFKAAAAGAPVSNMFSAYGGIRWGSGMSRMFQYERTQSRIGGTIWEYPLRYLENSPIFWADKVNTPVLMMHNDEDGAVPWYQGIEFFVALRRLSKPVWMINYNGEPHNLTKRQNRKDWAIRMQQFFDHYLKDAPAPVWMTDGVPAVMKGRTLGLELNQPETTTDNR